MASQTLEGLRATDAVVDLPVFRPLIGLDKVEIIELAQRIDTYKTSILPYDDCCTLFVPRRPATRPRLKQVAAAEAGLPVEELVKEALLQTEIIKVTEMGIEENKDHDGP